jgi:glycosyltransferase involved in cell wall biosynthesis
MKIAHIGNMANDGYAAVKALRQLGIDAELVINLADFGMSFPQWEVYNFTEDPYKITSPKEFVKKYPLPEWVRYYEHGKGDFLTGISNLFKVSRGYDLVHLHFPTFNYLQFSGLKYICYEAGFIRNFFTPNRKLKSEIELRHWEMLARRAYENAECVTWVNTDMQSMINRFHVKSEEFVPFSIDTNRYIPSKSPKNHDDDTLLIYQPTRQAFDIKGNDMLHRAFIKFIKDGYKGKLVLTDWGYAEDVAQAHEMLKPVEEHVTWVAPMSKPDLIKMYQEADVVADQFDCGASGTSGFEAMSCGTPLLIYLATSASTSFGTDVPHANAYDEHQIYKRLVELTDKKTRDRLGFIEREFIINHSSEEVVANQLANIYRRILE